MGAPNARKSWAKQPVPPNRESVNTGATRTLSGHTEMSAIAEHAHDQGHSIHWKARVIGRKRDSTSRKIKEVLMNQKMERKCGRDRKMNQDNGLDLSKVWLDLAITP